ncbi:hypothetical protein JCM8208_006050 [Rhodotorula glutinis]
MTDYLTQLPAELFITICELVRDSRKGPYLGRISKAFLPVARRFVFRQVTVRSYGRLAKLCDILIASPGAALYMIELEVLLYDTTVDSGELKTATFNAAMRQLKRVSSFTMHYSSRLVKSIFSPTSSMLPLLQTLKIVDRFDGWSNPFDPINFRHLERYPHLSQVDLEVSRSVESLGRYRPTKHLPKLNFGWSLWLAGPLSGNNAVADLLSCVNTIRNLGLYDKTPSSTATLPVLLGAVRYPIFIQYLSLEQVADEPEPLVEAISGCPRLRILELRAGAWSSAMLPILHNLEHLEELYFQSSGLATDDLRSILEGPLKVIKLKRSSSTSSTAVSAASAGRPTLL